MGNLFASFNTGVSGIHSAQASMNTAAHNLANATTPGHTRQQAVVTDAFYTSRYGAYSNKIQVGLGTDVVKIRQIRNTFLDDQYRVQVGRQSFYEAQYEAVQEMEELFGEMEGQEFLVSMKDMWSAMSELAKDSGNITLRSEFVSQASQFVERAQVLQKQLNDYQENMNAEVQNQVNEINNIVSQIRDYNMLIRKYESTGEGANDYRDARNLLLDQLGSIIKFKPIEEKDGTISIYSEGEFLLEGNHQYRLTTAYESDTSKLLKPVWETGEDYFFRGELEYSVKNMTDVGSLRGLLVARGNHAADFTNMPVKPVKEDYVDEFGTLDERAWFNANEKYNKDVEEYNENVEPSIVMKVQAEFDQLIRGIAMMINDTLCPNKELELADGTKIKVLDTDKAPIGDDADETIGTELFVRKNKPRYTETSVTILNEDGTTRDITVYQYNEENVEDRASLYTIDQLEVNPELLRNPSKLPLVANKNSGFVDGYTKDTCDELLEKWQKDFSTMDPNSMTTYNFSGYYTALVDQFSTDGNVWSGIIENQIITVNGIDGERQNVMGVATDEELADLIKFQKCFDASSRYITVVDEMIEHLITSL